MAEILSIPTAPLITYRVLNAEETAAFRHPFLPTTPEPNPDVCRIVVAEAGGELIGFQLLITVIHAEPIWVDPRYRGTTVAHRLFTKALSLLDEFRASMAFAFSENSTIAEYLHRLGLRTLPYQVHLYDPHDLFPKDT